jgi:DNA replication and repair protein RecF
MARRPEALGWKVRAPRSGRAQVETWAEPGAAARQVRIDGKPAPQAALGRILRMVWLTPAMDRLWTDAAEGRRRFLDRLALAFEPGHAEAALAYEARCATATACCATR